MKVCGEARRVVAGVLMKVLSGLTLDVHVQVYGQHARGELTSCYTGTRANELLKLLVYAALLESVRPY